MAQPRPSLTLILDLDERLDSEDVRLEIDRCYSYVGSTLVRTHPACDGEPQNIMRFLVKLGTHRYLRAEDEGADELWNDVMERWFYNELYKVSNNMLIYNRRQREVGNPQLVFDWIDVELQNGQLHALLHCDNVSGIRPETSELLTQLRAAYNEGALGEDVVRAYLPAPASYEEQKAAGLAAAEEAFLELPRLANDAAEEEDEPALEPFALDEPDFEVDYRLWLIEYADGSTRTFDSHAGTLA